MIRYGNPILKPQYSQIARPRIATFKPQYARKYTRPVTTRSSTRAFAMAYRSRSYGRRRRYRRKRFVRRKRYGRKSSRRTLMSGLHRPLAALPRRKIVRLRSTWDVNQAATATPKSYFRTRVKTNSLEDIVFHQGVSGGVNVQQQGFDDHYAKYQVLGTKITVLGYPNSGTNGNRPFIIAVKTVGRIGNSTTDTIPKNHEWDDTADGSWMRKFYRTTPENPKRFKHKFNIWNAKYRSQLSQVAGYAPVSGKTSGPLTSPDDLVWFYLDFHCANNTDTLLPDIRMTFQLDHLVLYYEQKDLEISSGLTFTPAEDPPV